MWQWYWIYLDLFQKLVKLVKTNETVQRGPAHSCLPIVHKAKVAMLLRLLFIGLCGLTHTFTLIYKELFETFLLDFRTLAMRYKLAKALPTIDLQWLFKLTISLGCATRRSLQADIMFLHFKIYETFIPKTMSWRILDKYFVRFKLFGNFSVKKYHCWVCCNTSCYVTILHLYEYITMKVLLALTLEFAIFSHTGTWFEVTYRLLLLVLRTWSCLCPFQVLQAPEKRMTFCPSTYLQGNVLKRNWKVKGHLTLEDCSVRTFYIKYNANQIWKTKS